ncbi:MAG TPA: sulfate transporter family protein [Xanthobacteraceae bacterium]|nr:sulfate transporter family protein [Xanthobacteraceae bacterium]
MLDAVLKALGQMFSQPFRAVLLKSVGLSIAILALVVIVLFRLLEWLSGAGRDWLEAMIGPAAHGPLAVLGWIIAIALSLGLFTGAVLLMPAVTALVASFFADEIAEMVERSHYPSDPPGAALPLWLAAVEGIKTAFLAIAVYLCALPFFLFVGAGAVAFFVATAWLLGRQYFELAAMRFRRVAEAKALRRRHEATVFTAGLFIAGFVSIPILNLATPLFGVAVMVHMHKRLTGSPQRDSIESRSPSA